MAGDSITHVEVFGTHFYNDELWSNVKPMQVPRFDPQNWAHCCSVVAAFAAEFYSRVVGESPGTLQSKPDIVLYSSYHI